MNGHISIVLLLLFVLFTPEVRAQDGTPAEAVVKWNQVVLEVAEKEDGFLTLKGLRTAVMMHVAMHDALNSVEPVYATYSSSTSVSDADKFVSLNQAAFTVASAQYPDMHERFEELRDVFVSDKKEAKGRGIELAVAISLSTDMTTNLTTREI